MGFSLNHLWRQVVQRSTECGPPEQHIYTSMQTQTTPKTRALQLNLQAPHKVLIPGGRCMNRPTKICNLQLSVGPKQQVFWLDVPVNDLLGVTVVECISQFHDVLETQDTHHMLDNSLLFKNMGSLMSIKKGVLLWHFCPRWSFHSAVAHHTVHLWVQTQGWDTHEMGHESNRRDGGYWGACRRWMYRRTAYILTIYTKMKENDQCWSLFQVQQMTFRIFRDCSELKEIQVDKLYQRTSIYWDDSQAFFRMWHYYKLC